MRRPDDGTARGKRGGARPITLDGSGRPGLGEDRATGESREVPAMTKDDGHRGGRTAGRLVAFLLLVSGAGAPAAPAAAAGGARPRQATAEESLPELFRGDARLQGTVSLAVTDQPLAAALAAVERTGRGHAHGGARDRRREGDPLRAGAAGELPAGAGGAPPRLRPGSAAGRGTGSNWTAAARAEARQRQAKRTPSGTRLRRGAAAGPTDPPHGGPSSSSASETSSARWRTPTSPRTSGRG